MTKKIQFRAFIPPIMSAIRTGGDSLRLTFDVPESDMLAAIALIALRDTALRITVEVDDSKTATPVATEKGPTPFGGYWRCWLAPDSHGAAPIFSTMLIDALKLDGEPATKDTIHEALRAVMGVTSLSREVSPDAFEAWLDERQLVGLKTMSRQIRARLQREEAKAS
jgi:hypothetical protein